jgi:hypothetical protein
MSDILDFRPSCHPDYAFGAGDFAATPEEAFAYGQMKACGERERIPIEHGGACVDIAIYLRRGWAAWRIAALTGLGRELIEAFAEGLAASSGSTARGPTPPASSPRDGERSGR